MSGLLKKVSDGNGEGVEEVSLGLNRRPDPLLPLDITLASAAGIGKLELSG